MKQAYEIKGIKSFKGHEGEPCSQGSLYLGSKKVCEWSDDSWGGSMQVRFIDKASKLAFVPFAREQLTGKLDLLGKLFDVTAMDDETVVNEAVEHLSYIAGDDVLMRKLCKTKLVFTEKNKSGKGALDIYTVSGIYTDTEVASLRAKNPDLLEIVNARYADVLIESSAAHIEAETAFYSRACKTKTHYVRKVDGRRAVFISSMPYTAIVGKRLRAMYPDIIRIINEAFVEPSAKKAA